MGGEDPLELRAMVDALTTNKTEFFREPDAHIGFDAGFLTRGMMLSLPMILIGLWLLMRSRRA